MSTGISLFLSSILCIGDRLPKTKPTSIPVAHFSEAVFSQAEGKIHVKHTLKPKVMRNMLQERIFKL